MYHSIKSKNLQITRVDLCFDFESRASAVLRLKFRGREAILNRAQNRNIPDFSRDSRNIWRESELTGQEILNTPNFRRESRNIGRVQSQHRWRKSKRI